MLEFHRKKYGMTIEISEKRSIKIKYLQGTFGELLEMSETMEASNEGLLIWLADFITDHSVDGEGIAAEELAKLPSSALIKILQPILDSFARGYFSRLDNEKETKMKAEKYPSPKSSFVCYILQNSNETLESLKRMTWEMIINIQEGIIWNLREQTKEGQKENRKQAALKAHRAEMSDEQAIELAKELARRMDEGKLQLNQDKQKTDGR